MRTRTLLILMTLCFVLLYFTPADAQGATRPITLSWTDSSSTGVTGYSLYLCTSTTAVACTPSVTGTPVQTFTSSATSGVVQGTIGLYYTIVLVANAPACTPTTPVTTACGSSAPVAFTPNPIPVPPQVNGVTVATAAVP
jgi:hypothetical protein